jgi:RNA polymerase sigma-70 factor (ECF subfamily)
LIAGSMSESTDDFALMVRLAEGDDLALNAIMGRWKERIGAFLYRLTGDHETALDLTQETFVRLYASRHKYKPSAAFSTFLFHIAANLARSHARWKGRHPSVPLHDSDGTMIHDPADPAPTPDFKADLADRTTAVQTAIDELPHDLKHALLLFTLEDMSHAQIGKVMGCSEKAVEVKIYRARQSLKAALAANPF